MAKRVILHRHDGNIETMDVSDELAEKIANAIEKGELAFRGRDSGGQFVYINIGHYAVIQITDKPGPARIVWE